MPDRKSSSLQSRSTFSPSEKIDMSCVHPRFVSRIKHVLLEKNEAAQQSLANTYCLLKKVENQLVTHKTTFSEAQYDFLITKCEALCRNSRLLATNDRPDQSQVLALKDEVIELRKAIAAIESGEFRTQQRQPSGFTRPPVKTGQGTNPPRKTAGEKSANDEHSLNRKLILGRDSPVKSTALAVSRHPVQSGQFSL